MRSLLFLLILVSLSVYGQDGKYTMGARQAGFGGASVAVSDQWSLFNNLAGLADLADRAAMVSYENRFGLKELQTIGAGYMQPLNDFVVGGGFYRFGGDLYSEQRVNVGVAHRLDQVSLGLSVNYLQFNISTVDTKGLMVLEFGGIAKVTEQVSIGLHISNLNQANLTEDEKAPTVMRAGFLFQLSSDFILALETEKDLDFPEVYKAGLEYRIIEKVWVRTGLRTEPFVGSFGVGFKPKDFQFDYAFSSDSVMGAIHEVSVGLTLARP